MALCMQDTETTTTKPQGRGKSSNSILSADICLLYVVLRMQTCCSGVCRTYTLSKLAKAIHYNSPCSSSVLPWPSAVQLVVLLYLQSSPIYTVRLYPACGMLPH